MTAIHEPACLSIADHTLRLVDEAEATWQAETANERAHHDWIEALQYPPIDNGRDAGWPRGRKHRWTSFAGEPEPLTESEARAMAGDR